MDQGLQFFDRDTTGIIELSCEDYCVEGGNQLPQQARNVFVPGGSENQDAASGCEVFFEGRNQGTGGFPIVSGIDDHRWTSCDHFNSSRPFDVCKSIFDSVLWDYPAL